MRRPLPGQLEIPFEMLEFALLPECKGGCIYVSTDGRVYGFCLKCGVPYVHTHDALKAPNEK